MNATIGGYGVVCYTAVFRVVTQRSISGLIEELCMGSNVQVANCLVSHSFVKANAFLSSVRANWSLFVKIPPHPMEYLFVARTFGFYINHT